MQHGSSSGTYSRSATKEIQKTVYFRSKDRLSKACVLRHGHTFYDCVSFRMVKLFIRIIHVVISARFQFHYWILQVRATFNLLYFRPATGSNACVSALLATRLSMFLCPVQSVDFVLLKKLFSAIFVTV